MFTSSFKSFVQQNRSALYCFLLSGFFFFLASLDLQGHTFGKLISISPLVGHEIDRDEYFRYRFHEIESVQKREFLSARVYQLNKNLFLLQIELKRGKERLKSFNQMVLSLFRLNIERYGKKLLRSVDLLEAKMKEGRSPFVQVVLTNDMIMQGNVMALRASGLSLKSKIGLFDFPMETVRVIAFLDESNDPVGRFVYAKK